MCPEQSARNNPNAPIQKQEQRSAPRQYADRVESHPGGVRSGGLSLVAVLSQYKESFRDFEGSLAIICGADRAQNPCIYVTDQGLATRGRFRAERTEAASGRSSPCEHQALRKAGFLPRASPTPVSRETGRVAGKPTAYEA